MATLSERLKQLRAEKKESQGDLAELLSISRTSYCKYETDRHEPSVDYLIKLANHYDVTVDYLVGNTDSRSCTNEVPEDESEVMHKFRVSDDKALLMKLWNDTERYNLSDEEAELVRAYRTATKNGRAAIIEFADFMANKNKRHNK